MVHETFLLWPPASAIQRGDGPRIQWFAPGVNGGDPESAWAFCIPVRPRDEA